jgi:UDP-N-acetylmuramyl pentapeptide phosphotransferase/UDP-N-acetylglucosamine-1-phosphate transferase
MMDIAFFLPVFLAGLFSWLLCLLLRRKLVMDMPNGRSLHALPVPRGAGIAVMAAVLPLWAFFLKDHDQISKHVVLMAGTLLLAGISWWDDKKNLPPHIRFAVHIMAVGLGLGSLTAGEFIFGGALPFWLDRLLAGLCWLWFINLTNFMDGIDGITGSNTVHLSLGFALIAVLGSFADQSDTVLAMLLLGASLGFLFWNWHPAKMFLGDVGSIPLGYLTGYLMIMLAVNGHLAIALTLPLYYIADASFTLIRRQLEGKKIWQAHREHFYQQAALAAGHRKTVKAIIAANALLLALAALSLQTSPFVLVSAPLPVLGLIWYLKRLRQQPV